MVLDGDAVITFASDSVTTVLGWEPHELIGVNGYDLVHPDEVEAIATARAELAPGGAESLRFENRVKHADGGWRWVDSTITRLSHHPDVQGTVVNFHDITGRRQAEADLRASEKRLRSVLDHSPDLIAFVDAEFRLQWVTPNISDWLGYRPADLLGQSTADIIHPADAHLMTAGSELLQGGGQPEGTFTVRARHADDGWRWFEVRATNLLDDPDVDALVVTARDVTERVQGQADRDRLNQILEASSDLVVICDVEGRPLYANQAALDFFSIGAADLHELRLEERAPGWAQRRYQAEVLPALQEKGTWSGELAYFDGETEVPFSALCVVHLDEEGTLAFVSLVLRDISERKAFERRLKHAATHDPLTLLPNRTLLLDRLHVALRRSQRTKRMVAVLFLDIDHFKVVNDSLGHGTGDQLLVHLAGQLSDALRPGDTVARFGGDEFVVLCEDLGGPADAVRIAERIDAGLREPFVTDGSEVFVTVSIGIALAADATVDAESIVRDADAAMYQAKERGRDRFEMFDPKMRNGAVDRLDIESSLRRAIERDELRTHYQPKVSLETGKIVGVEALLRWQHPDQGLLEPSDADFIRVAEDTGLIVPIGAWVLGETFRQVSAWEEQIPHTSGLFACVNLSWIQLNDPGLVDELAAMIRETGIDPGHVDLEMTESVLLEDVAACQETLARLKDLGVKIVVDDFGTGYSSLSYLQQFPVDLLKVDRSFVAGMETGNGDRAIVEAVVGLAHTLGLEAIAEGVETPEQLAQLRDLGCEYAQGYLIAPPQSAEAIEALLEADPTF